MIPKVLIFTVIYDQKDYCLQEFLRHSKKISYPNKRHIFIDNSTGQDYYIKLKRLGLDAFHIERGNNSREALARSQNLARQMAEKQRYDYLFSLESDIMVPENIIQRLMMHCKPVVTALYTIGTPEIPIPCITMPYFDEKISAFGTKLLPREEWENYRNNGLKQVQAGGFGTCLIYKSVFTRFKFTYDVRFTGHSDVYFFNDCFNERIPVYVDTDIICEHKNSDWNNVKDR